MPYGLWHTPDINPTPELFEGVSEIILRGNKVGFDDESSIQSQVKFYPVELSTGELNIFTGPQYVAEDGSTFFKPGQMWGGYKPGIKIYLSPGFLWRYCAPSTERFIDPVNKRLGPMEVHPPSLMILADEMYPYYKNPCDLENVINFLQDTGSHRGHVYGKIHEGIFRLESTMAPKAFPDHEPTVLNSGYRMMWSNMSVDTHDFIVTFNRLYNFGQTPHVGDEKYAICLLSEIHDIHFKEEDEC